MPRLASCQDCLAACGLSVTFPLIISGPIVYNLQPPGNRILCHKSRTRFHALISQIFNISYTGVSMSNRGNYNNHVITSTAYLGNDPSDEVTRESSSLFIML